MCVGLPLHTQAKGFFPPVPACSIPSSVSQATPEERAPIRRENHDARGCPVRNVRQRGKARNEKSDRALWREFYRRYRKGPKYSFDFALGNQFAEIGAATASDAAPVRVPGRRKVSSRKAPGKAPWRTAVGSVSARCPQLCSMLKAIQKPHGADDKIDGDGNGNHTDGAGFLRSLPNQMEQDGDDLRDQQRKGSFR